MLTAVMTYTPRASANADVGVGDFWEYQLDQMDLEGFSVNGTMKLEVKETDSMTVMGTTQDVFRCSMTGSATLGGSFNGTMASGTMTISGEQTVIASNFSIVSESMTMSMDMSVMGFAMTMIMGTEMNLNPPSDNYIGDNELALGTTVTSTCHATGSMYMNTTIPPLFPGMDPITFNETTPMDIQETYTMRIVDTEVTVHTYAGDFSCYVVNATSNQDGILSGETLYYSEEVGNYVKYEGGYLTGGLLLGGDMTLKSYSHGGGATDLTLFLIGFGVIAAVVIIAIVLVVVMKKRGGAAPGQVPPPQPWQQAPPPPPPPTQ